MAGGRIKGITVEIDGDATGLSTALKGVNSEIKNTESQLKDVEKLLKMDPGNTELLTQKQKLLNDEIGKTKEKLETLKTASAQAKTALENGQISTEQYDALQREIIETEEKLKSLETQANSSATAIQKVAATGENIKKTGQSVTAAGQSMMPVTAAVVALGTAAVKTTADFDSGMSQVAAVSGATGEELEALTAKAREMGAKTKFSASEAAEAMNYMAMAGWKTSDMLSGIEGIMNLAAASGEELGTTSDIVTDALTAFGLTAADSAHFADILAAASSNANTNVSMMGETFKYCAPVAGALGYSAEDVAEAIGLMANAGIKASQAGTSMRTTLTSLQGEITITGESLGEVTIQTANADGSMRNLSDILDDCRAAFSQLTESEAASTAESLVGKNAMSGFLALMQAAPSDIEKLRGAISTCSDEVDGYNGTCEKMAAVMQDNLSGQLVILKSQLEELAISFGTIMIPALRKVITVIQGIVDKFNNLDEGTKERIINIALIVAAIGPLLIVIGKLLTSVGSILTAVPKIVTCFSKVSKVIKGLSLGTKIASLGSVLAKVKTAFSALWAVLAANPIVLIIAAIVAIVAAFIILWNKSESFRNFWINLWNNIKTAAVNAWNGIKTFFSTIWTGISTLAQTIWGGISTFFSNLWLSITTTITTVWTAISTFFTTVWTAIKTTFMTVVTAISTWLTTTWTAIQTTVTTIWTAISTFFTTIWTTISTTFQTVLTAISTWLSTTWTTIQTVITTVWTAIQTFFITIWTAISTFFTTTLNSISETMTTVWTTISEFVSTILNTIFTSVSTVFTEMWTAITTFMGNIYNSIAEGFNNAVSFIHGLIGQAFSWGADLIGNIVNGIKSMIGSVISACSSIASTIRSYLHFSVPDVGPLTDFESWMPDFMKGLAEGIEDNRGVLKKAMAGVASDLVVNPMMGNFDETNVSGTASKSVIQHSGTIKVEGVNDAGALSGVVDIIIDQLRQEVRA